MARPNSENWSQKLEKLNEQPPLTPVKYGDVKTFPKGKEGEKKEPAMT